MDIENRRPRRTNLELEKDLLQATHEEIIAKGFASLTVIGIAKRAEIDPGVFYKRYKGLDELLQVYVQQNDYWYNSMFDSFDKVPYDDYGLFLKEIFVTMIKHLIKDKSMQELILWELWENNDITSLTNRMREEHMSHIVNELDRYFIDKGVDINFRVVTSVLLSASYFLIIHKGKNIFCNIDFKTKEGQKLLIYTIEQMADRLLLTPEKKTQIADVARKMKLKGIDTATIAECTGLDEETIIRMKVYSCGES